MSTPSSLSNGTMIMEADIFRLTMDGLYSSAAFFAYSYLLLLGKEITYVWKHPTRPSSWLYLLIRYPGLLETFINVSLNSYTPHCTALDQLTLWLQNVSLIATYLLQIIRTYAVCGKRRLLAALLAALCIPAIVVYTLEAVNTTCTAGNTVSPVALTVSIVFDILLESLIIVATVWGTWSQLTAEKDLRMSRQTLAHSLLRNGLLYYIVFLAIQVSNAIGYNLQAIPTATKILVFSAQFDNIIRWTLTCQFILELRERSEKLSTMSDISLPTISSSNRTLSPVRAAIELDFGERLVHPIHSIDLEDMDDANSDGVTDSTKTGIELQEPYWAPKEGQSAAHG